jgi:hypothetical protein
MALLAALMTLAVAVVIATRDKIRVEEATVRVAEITAVAESREALLAEVQGQAAAWKLRGNPPQGDRHPLDARVTVSSRRVTPTEWNMEVEGPPAALAAILGGNLRSAQLQSGARPKTLEAHLEHDSATIPAEWITIERAERWSRSAR